MKYSFTYNIGSGIPLGGIGAGSVEIKADGRLYEWTIFNNGGYAERQDLRFTYYLDEQDSFFAVRQKGIVRVLQAFDYNFGGNPYILPWLRPVERVEFNGEPPIANLEFVDKISVKMKAFSPFIPTDLKNSSLPSAIFTLESNEESDFMFGIKNPFNEGNVDFKDNTLILSGEVEPNDPRYQGNLCIKILADYPFARVIERHPSEEFQLWHEFRENGRLENKLGKGNFALIGGKGRKVTFVLSWYFPNHLLADGRRIGHYYENFFSNCLDVAKYVESNLTYLESKTTAFHDLLYNVKGIDSWIADLVSSQLTTLIKSTWLAKDGFFGIWEGYLNATDKRKTANQYPYSDGPLHTALNTIDVLTYSLPTILNLFPELAEKIILQFKDKLIEENTPEHVVYSLSFEENREKFLEKLSKDPSLPTDGEKLYSTINEIVKETGKDPKGRVPHFLTDNLRVDEYHRVDLNPEFILMSYLIAKTTGDLDFLKEIFPKMQEALESTMKTQTYDGLIYHTLPAGIEWLRYLNNKLNLPRADSNSASILGHNFIPLSMQTFDDWSMIGIASFTSTLWISSIQAVNDACSNLKINCSYDYESLVKKLIDYLWNGEYFDLWYDPISKMRDKACNASQLLGHWYSTLLGLRFLDDSLVKTTLKSIVKYNLKEEEGLLNGAYPNGYRPLKRNYQNQLNLPATTQIDTPWSGVEFYVASHLIYEKLRDEGEKILRNIYERYKLAGNFWNHLEWGSHYSRPLDSLMVIHAYEGLKYDGITKTLTIDPAVEELSWIIFLPTGWGKIEISKQKVSIKMFHGVLEINKLKAEPKKVLLNGKEANLPIELKEGDSLDILY